VRHDEGAAVCGRVGLSIGPRDHSSTTRSLVRQLVPLTLALVVKRSGDQKVFLLGLNPNKQIDLSQETTNTGWLGASLISVCLETR